MPALSILLPTYNGARFLGPQLDSIIAQTFDDWELLLCDDGSSDATPALLLDAAARDPRIRVVPSHGNHGQKRRLAELATAATAPLVSISDQDDIWQPDKLEILIRALGDAGLVFGASWLIDAAAKPLGRTLLDSVTPPAAPGDRLTYLFRPAVSAHAAVMRRELLAGQAFARALPFDWLLSLGAAFGRGLIFEPAAKTLHRMHGANQMNGPLADAPAPRKRFVAAITQQFAHLAARRFTFLTLTEYVAHSPAVAEDIRRVMAEAYQLCHGAWHGGATMPVRDLTARLEALLKPLAGSPDDWTKASAQLAALTASPLHPARALRQLRRLIR